MSNAMGYLFVGLFAFLLGALLVYTIGQDHAQRAGRIGDDIADVATDLDGLQDGLANITGGLETGASQAGAIANGLGELEQGLSPVIDRLTAGEGTVERGLELIARLRERAGPERP
jgi:uncharacterized phage infection (PIP) family protein YhgE